MALKTKSVYEPIDREGDGLRILATRFRGRGLHKSRYDVWMPNLGPTEALLEMGQQQAITWAQFERRYRKEMVEDGPIDDRCRTIKNHGQKFTLRLLRKLSRGGNNVTLLCHCDRNQKRCHRHILRQLIIKSM